MLYLFETRLQQCIALKIVVVKTTSIPVAYRSPPPPPPPCGLRSPNLLPGISPVPWNFCARWSPSNRNLSPWSFSWIRKAIKSWWTLWNGMRQHFTKYTLSMCAVWDLRSCLVCSFLWNPIEGFTVEDEKDYEYEIFSILSIAHTWTSVILAGKRNSRRRSTTSFTENVVMAGTIYQM